MALTEPYPLAFLSSILRIASCQFDQLRFEEASGSGGGQRWAAEMDDPLWQVTIALANCNWPLAREVNAKVVALGSMKSMLFADPRYMPAAGGSPGAGATIGSISAARNAIALAGLPAAYRVTAGDRLSINSGGVSLYFGEFAETLVANGSGQTAQISINPPLPQSLAAGAAVALGAPVLRARVGSYTPYAWQLGDYGSGASLTLVQRR